MSYAITKQCIRCNSCLPECPVGAISIQGGDYWIDTSLCNSCEGFYDQPQCVVLCPVDSPVPFQAKKGRCKIGTEIATSPNLFPNEKNNSFASAILIWELCNVLAQRSSLPWQTNEAGELLYQRQVNKGQGSIACQITDTVDQTPPIALQQDLALSTIEAFDIRAACLHLIYAAHATALERPWEQEFVISDRQIEEYLGLEKRKDLSKPTKLALIKELAQQPCKVIISLHWNQQGKVKAFSFEQSRLWHLLEIQHHFQEDELGCKHLTGLTFRVQAGEWARYFLNKQHCEDRTAFYQYGCLPKSLLGAVMSHWQQHEGATRMLLWLLFKAKMGIDQRVTVPTLMRVAYGEDRVMQASFRREERKRLLRSFESDLGQLSLYGTKPIFDPATYPPEIQPLWAKLEDLPDDAEAALEFWTNDGGNETRLTDISPRGKWNRLMGARILRFELPPDWQSSTAESGKKKARSQKRKIQSKQTMTLDGQQVIAARQRLGWSQRDLAEKTGKSQSWIRDIEKGRFRAKPRDLALLQKVLNLA